ncbi:store-operated calcium entry-associated regulatory factor-like [Rhipicephalus microplus]|uniref:store-operated calcium entry-associated regulatory factor-like n=1 Tax=Rhipicephalus microplus TaxID=6941 RepID=UPI003F6CD4E3
MSYIATTVVFLSVFAHPSSCFSGDRVKLTDVQTLTLRQGQYTTGRRSHPVPQLNCRGGSAGCQDQPSVVQCYNRGTDGRDVQWECKAEMKRSQKFGLLQVTCEGYDYTQDEYILVGSCGLEYYLEKTSYGGRSSNGANGLHRPRAHHILTRPTSGIPLLWNVIFSLLSVFGSCCLCLCCLSLCCGNANLFGSVHRTRQNLTSCDAGYRPLINYPAAEQCAPPPPYYPGGNPPAYNPNYVSASQWPTTNSCKDS